MTARGRLDGDLQRAQALQESVNARLDKIDVSSPVLGGFSADVLDLTGVARNRGAKLQLPTLQASKVKWNAGVGPALRLLGEQQQLTLQQLTWDGAQRYLGVHSLLAIGGHVALLGAGGSVDLGMQQLRVRNGSGNLAREQFVVHSIQGARWNWQGRRGPWLRLSSLDLDSLRGDVVRRQLAIGTFHVHGRSISVRRRRNGALEPFAGLSSLAGSASRMPDIERTPQRPEAPRAPGTSAAPQTPPIPGAAGHTEQPAWSLSLQEGDVAIDKVNFRDAAGGPLPALTATNLLIHAGPWSSNGDQTLQEHVQLMLLGGTWRWDGTLKPQPLELDGKVQAEDIKLQSLDTLLGHGSYAALQRSSLSLAGQLSLRQRGGSGLFHYEGAAHARDTRIVDRQNQQVLLTCDAASIPAMVLEWPGSLKVSQLDLDGLHTELTILPDRRTNWQTVIRPAQVTADRASIAPALGKPPAAGAALSWPIHLERITLTKAGVDFADQSLKMPFHVKIHDLAGNIGPFVSNIPGAWTQMSLRGGVDHYGRVDMSGRIMPLASPLRAEATVDFGDIELPTLNPYAAEIAGYRIDQGMLNLQLRYTLDHGRVDGDNRARIDQLVLGPQVGQADVPDLPLRAILDILRDDDGVIELNVPISGDLNRPDVTIRDIAFAAVENALRKTLESPFHLLASVLRRDTESLRHVGFAGGAAQLTGADQDKLRDMARLLARHQNMRVFIRPTYYESADAASVHPVKAGGDPPRGAPSVTARLRALGLRRGETIKAALVSSGVGPSRVYIDEPTSLSGIGSDGTVQTTLDLKTQ